MMISHMCYMDRWFEQKRLGKDEKGFALRGKFPTDGGIALGNSSRSR